MRHPELIFLAADRYHVSVMSVINDACDSKRLYVSAKSLSFMYDKFMREGSIPEFVEDYALYLLAKHERETKLPNSIEQWLRV